MDLSDYPFLYLLQMRQKASGEWKQNGEEKRRKARHTKFLSSLIDKLWPAYLLRAFSYTVISPISFTWAPALSPHSHISLTALNQVTSPNKFTSLRRFKVLSQNTSQGSCHTYYSSLYQPLLYNMKQNKALWMLVELIIPKQNVNCVSSWLITLRTDSNN